MSFDEDLQHVLETLDISPKSKESLLDQKIVSFYDLRRTRELWKSTDFGLSAPARHTLDRAIKWFDHFSEKNSRSPNMCQDYSYEAHIAFDESAIEKSVSPELQKKLLLLADRDQDCREEIEEYLAEDGVSEDEFKPESRVIRSLGPSVQKVFEKPELDEMITENLSDLTSPTDVPILSYGKTQSGKSARKYVIMCTARSMGIPSVILTKGKSEALELDRKLKGLAAGTDLANLIMPMVRKSQVEEVTIRLENAGTIVTFDSCTRVDHTRTTILSFLAKNPHKRKFVLIVDECDSFLKTEDGSTKVEQALARLRSLSPWCEFQFTATPLAVMFDKPGSKIVLRNLKPSADYVGLEMMKPLRIDGEEQWLENRRDISSKDAWHEFYSNTKESTVKIPFTNEKVMAMYDDASKNPFALLLDASSNRVRPDLEGNVFLKADLVQDHLLAQGRRIVAVVIVGAGVYFKLPVSIDGGAQHGKEETFPGAKFPKGTRVAIVNNDKEFLDGEIVFFQDGIYRIHFSDGSHQDKNQKWVDEALQKPIDDFVGPISAHSASIGDVFQFLHDREAPTPTPIFCFGYAKLQRGISFRCDSRVPTHIIQAIGKSQSMAKARQGLGRATFNGKARLQENGFDHVTVLTLWSDFRCALAEQSFLSECGERGNSGGTTAEAIEGKEFRAESNMLAHCGREPGQIKGKRENIKRVSFEASEELPGDKLLKKTLKEKYPHSSYAIKALLRLLGDTGGTERAFTVDEILASHNSDKSQSLYLSKSAVQKVLKQLGAALIVEREGNGVNSTWRCGNSNRLARMIDADDDESLSDSSTSRAVSSSMEFGKRCLPSSLHRMGPSKLRRTLSESSDGPLTGLSR